MSHRGSLLFLPSGVYSWNVTAPEDLHKSNFSKLFEEADAIEILLLGTGTDLVPINPDLREEFRSANISADSMNTGAAARTFNVLLAEGRAVAAALLAVA